MFAFVFDHNHDNPFPVRGYHGNRCFCGREEETKSILSSLDNGMNVTLFSARRLGKTGLIQHAFSKLPAKKWVTIYFDILATTSLQGFIETFAAAVWEAENQRSSIGKKLLSFVKTLRPTINFDPMTGEAQVSLGFLSENEKKNTLKALLRQLNGLDKRVAIAIDEFQQVANYKEQNMEALLRTEIQNLHNLAFIFSGSQRDMLAEMFGSAKRPFFSSARMFKLEKLPAFIFMQVKKNFP